MDKAKINEAISRATGLMTEGWVPEPLDFCNDLNACHEMENTIYNLSQYLDVWMKYVDGLKEILGSNEWGFATAGQRVEFMVKALGKWEDEG